VLLSGTPIISEFMAINDSFLADEDGDCSDWIEIHNPGPDPVSLLDWCLTDEKGDTDPWRFPDVELAPGEQLVVFASDKDRAVAGGELHTDFKLSGDGEYLALLMPDGVTAVSEFDPFPEQQADVSYGIEMAAARPLLVEPGATAHALVPADGTLGQSWTAIAFDHSGWTPGATGVGYERGAGYDSLIGLDVEAGMYGANGSVYVRIPFTVSEGTTVSALTLRMKYDDGFAAYLNGEPVASRNAPDEPQWNTLATGHHPDAQAIVYEEIDLTAHTNLVAAGDNVLAIHGLNVNLASTDLLILPELEAQVLTATPEQLLFYTVATPGAPNLSDATLGFVADTTFGDDRGFYDEPFDLAIACATPGAEIRYTLDGGEPTATTGLVYTEPIPITGTVVVRAAAFKDGYEPSNVDTQTYLFLDDVLEQNADGAPPPGWPAGPVNGQVLDYGMDPDIVDDPTWGPQLAEALAAIPSFSLVTDIEHLFDPTTGIYVNPREDGEAWEVPTSVELLCADGTDGFQIDAGLRIRGGYSRSPNNPKHAFRLFFRGEYGDTKLVYPLFGDEGAAEFDKIDLRTSQNYSWSFHGDARNAMVRDVFSRDTQGAMGQPYTRSRYYHLYINGVYWGLYQTQERAEAAYGATYLEGDRDEFDTIKVEAGAYTINATDGTLEAWQELWNQANAGFESYEAYMKAQGLNPDGTRNPDYPVLLDIDNLIDYMLVIFYGGNRDAPISKFLSNKKPNNWYGLRNRNGDEGFVFFAHDSEHTLLVGDLNEDRTGPFPAGDAFQYSNPQWIHQQLMYNEEYRLRFADRIQEHFFNDGTLTPENAIERFLSRAGEIEQAIIAESARWGDAKVTTPRTKDDWEATIQDTVDNYFPYRTDIVLEQLRTTTLRDGSPAPLFPDVVAPAFSQHGGYVEPGFTFTMFAPVGTIHYTTDGSDPRLPGGAVSPEAGVYDSPITLAASTQVQARALVDGEWSPLTDAIFLVDPGDVLRVTEIMYHPADPPTGSPYLTTDFEFIELQNIGPAAVDLTGYHFTDGIDFTFPAMELAAGEHVVVVRNQAAFATRYGTEGITIAGEFTGLLDNAGEDLDLRSRFDQPIQAFGYNDGWYPATDGDGFSLVPVDPEGAPEAWDTKAGWRPSGLNGGSPGRDDVGLAPGTVVVNEVLSHTDDPAGDWIELWNATAGDVDVGGWYLSDDPAALTKYQIAAHTVIPGGSYLVFTQRDHFGDVAKPGCDVAFGLSELGDGVYLTSVDGTGALAGYRDDVDFGAAERDVTFGRYVKSTGADDFVALSAPTPLDANAAPQVGPVVINEIMYHPPAGGCEFIELHNPTGADVPLYDPDHTENTWRLADGVAFSFPTGTVLPAGGYLLVVPIDPGAFRSTYGVPAEIPIFGPYTGALDNNGEDVELHKPGEPEPDDTVPYIRVDRVNYNDKAPWPELADGTGASLSRHEPLAYGNDPANWRPSITGGTPGAANVNLDSTPPSMPEGLAATVASSSTIALAWDASADGETGVAAYRVYRNGALVASPDTPAFTDTGLATATPYAYRVAAVNAHGFESEACAPVPVTIVTVAAVQTSGAACVRVLFSGPVEAASAQTPASYTIDGASVLAAALEPDGRTVVLTTSELQPGATYTLSPHAVVAEGDGQLAPDSQRDFVAGRTPGLRGEYYNNSDFTSLALLRTDPTIDFEWARGSPDPAIGADTFSVRWTGQVRPIYSETYTFYTVSDDGVRLYVDGELLIDNWTLHGATEDSGTIELVAGQLVDIEMELYENAGYAVGRLLWSSPTQAKEIVPTSQLVSDPLPTFSVADLTIAEGHDGQTNAVFAVTVSADPPLAAEVAYATADGTATVADGDYAAASGTLTFQPGGPTTQTIEVPIHGDTRFEPDETFQLLLSSPRNAAVGDAESLATITNDDIPPPGPLEFDLAVAGPGGLNPTGPAPSSLTLITFDTAGAPPSSRYAFQIGTDPDAWLRFDDLNGVTVARADGQEPAWHTLGEWEGIRLVGLEPGTAYTFSGLGEIAPDVPTALVSAGEASTNVAGDVNRNGLATGLDYAYVLAAILRGASPGDDGAWIYDVNGDAVIDAQDLAAVHTPALDPPATAPGAAASSQSTPLAAQAAFAHTRRPASASPHAPLDRDGDGDVDRDDIDALLDDYRKLPE